MSVGSRGPARLPVRVGCFQGEGLISYARRAAAANHLTVEDVESALRSQGYVFPQRRESEERRNIWRILGGLHSSAFTETEQDVTVPLSYRQLCAKCSAGQPATGLLSAIGGDVCLRHRRWLGDGVQVDVSGAPEFLTAERTFHRVLMGRGLSLGSVVFMNCRGIGQCLPEHVVQSRLQRLRLREAGTELLGYPETVALAVMLTNDAFLDQVLSPARPESRRAFLDQRTAAAVHPMELVESWRIRNVLWNSLKMDYEHLTSTRLRGVEPDPAIAVTLPFWTSRPRWEDVQSSRNAIEHAYQRERANPGIITPYQG